MKLKQLSLLSAVALLSVVGCAGTPSSSTTSSSSSDTTSSSGGTSSSNSSSQDIDFNDDDTIFEAALGEYQKALDAINPITGNTEEYHNDSKRYVRLAQAEAKLLDSAVMLPTTTDGGSWAITRIAPNSVPSVQWGTDNDKLKSLVISDDFITREERAELKELYEQEKAKGDEGNYDPAAYLVKEGHVLQTEYHTLFSMIPETLDIHNNSRATTTEYLANMVEGLVQYDNLGNLKPCIATSWEKSIENGKTTYTFTLRQDAKWFKSSGEVYAGITAQDFVDGFHHMLDCSAGLGELVCGVVDGAEEYFKGETTKFDEVGIKATDTYTLKITLTADIPYFLSMLTYSTFMPMNANFFTAQGGVFGRAKFKSKSKTAAYKYGKSGASNNIDTILYNSAYLCTKITDGNQIVFQKNPNYYDADKVLVSYIDYTYTDSSDTDAYWNACLAGTYTGCTLSSELMTKAKANGYYDEYAYQTSTQATTYFLGYNLNRKNYGADSEASLQSTKLNNETEQTKTKKALINKNFRKALSYAFSKKTWNGITTTEDLAETSLRNMLVSPDFVSTTETVTIDDKTWESGTVYGDMVQYYLDQISGDGIRVQDGVDGWYLPTKAAEYFAEAKKELGEDFFKDGPVQIDIINYSKSSTLNSQAQYYKKAIEEAFGSEYVTVNIMDTSNLTNYNNASYYGESSDDMNYDLFWGSGWGADYGDPLTYLNSLSENGYMTKVIGLF